MKGCDLEFDLSRTSNIKAHITSWKPIYDFLSVSNTNYVFKVNRFWVIMQWKDVTLSLTFQGHPTSKIKLPFESPYMISYLCQIQNIHQTWMVSEILIYENLWPWVWPLKVIQHQRSYHHLKAYIWFPICYWYKLSA